MLLEKYLFSRFVPIGEGGNTSKSKVAAVFYKLLTLFIVLVGWVLFRVENLGDLASVLGSMFSFSDGDFALYVAEHAATCSKLFYVIPGIIIAGRLPSAIAAKTRKAVPESVYFALKAVIAIALFAVSVMFLIASSYNPFIYFRF